MLIFNRQVLIKADMLDYYSVSGCYILKPWSYSIWEEIQRMTNRLPSSLVSNALNRMVQLQNQRARRPKLLLSDVRVVQSPRAGERSY